MILLSASLLLFVNCKKEDKVSVETDANQYKSSSVKSRLATKECDADFDIFFKKFASDSVFQKLHTRFPLKSSHLDEDYHDLIRDDIPLSKFQFIDFSKHKEARNMEIDRFIVSTEKRGDSVFYYIKGRDNGIMSRIKFFYDGKCWTMVEIIDEST